MPLRARPVRQVSAVLIASSSGVVGAAPLTISKMSSSLLLSALYTSVNRHRVQVTVVNRCDCTSKILLSVPPTARNCPVSYSVFAHFAHSKPRMVISRFETQGYSR